MVDIPNYFSWGYKPTYTYTYNLYCNLIQLVKPFISQVSYLGPILVIGKSPRFYGTSPTCPRCFAFRSTPRWALGHQHKA